MSAPQRYHGKDSRLYANGYKIYQFIKKWKLGRKADVPEDTVIGTTSDARTRVADGLVDASLDCDGKFADESGEIDDQLSNSLNAANVVWNVLPFGDSAVGDAGYGLQCVENSYDSTVSHNDIVLFSTSAEGSAGDDDVAERTKTLHPLAAVTTTGTGTALDNGAASTTGGAAYLQCTDASSPTTLDVIVQGSTTGAWGGEETTIATFTQLTTAHHAQRVEIAGTIPRYTRSKHTVAGTSWTYFCALHRNP